MSKKEREQLRVVARAPFRLYYEGPANAVSAANRVGPFDILPDHADFFSILKPGQVVIDISKDEDPLAFDISSGIVTVRDNEVMLFVNV